MRAAGLHEVAVTYIVGIDGELAVLKREVAGVEDAGVPGAGVHGGDAAGLGKFARLSHRDSGGREDAVVENVFSAAEWDGADSDGQRETVAGADAVGTAGL